MNRGRVAVLLQRAPRVRLYGLGFRVEGLELRVQGMEFGV
jgi:hypothetical protein